jgi:mono/diheme cytochrome c family protein
MPFEAMRILSLLILLLLGAGYLCSSARPITQQEPVKPAGLSAEDAARAKALVKSRCARCHGPDGRGQTVLGDMLEVPDFTNSKWWKNHDNDEPLIRSITSGNGDMPAFGKKLTKPEIALLVSYLRQFNQPDR